jgi:hypothetical protein
MLLADILEAREELESATTEDEVAAIREANHGTFWFFLPALSGIPRAVYLCGSRMNRAQLTRSQGGSNSTELDRGILV